MDSYYFALASFLLGKRCGRVLIVTQAVPGRLVLHPALPCGFGRPIVVVGLPNPHKKLWLRLRGCNLCLLPSPRAGPMEWLPALPDGGAIDERTVLLYE